MRYIEFKAELTNEINLRSSDNETLRDSISVKCVDFCENNKNGFCVFISNLKGNECRFVIGGNGFNERLSAEGKRFWKSLGLKGKIVSFKEISAEKTMKLMRGRSEISTHFDIEELLKLDSLKSSWFDERIVEISTPAMLKKIGIKRNICELKAEAERISKCNLDRFVGHPVHYIISDNNNESFDNVANALVGCLVKAKRLESSRIMILDGDNDSLSYHCEYIRDMYENMYGGTIIFSIGYSEESEEYADSDSELLENVCKCARRFKNKVLTIFHIGRHDIKRANAIAAYLRDEIALIHFKEDIMSKAESKKYLCALADEKDISDKSELLKQFEVEIDKCYASDLDRLFNKYYSGYIRSVIYPQYFNINKVEESNPRVKGNAADELNKMIGLDKAKGVIYKTVSFFKLLSLYNERGIEIDPPARSMIFTGNPGTAKTTVARLTAKIYKDNGIVDSGRLVEVGRADLVGKYVGHTAPKVQEAFRRAKGSILFIDEAYSLVDDRDGLYGDEAINTIVQEMENHRDDTIVIFAGYPDKMENFIKKNPGLRSRIAFHVDFPDYKENELLDILRLMAKNKGMNLSVDAENMAINIFSEAVKKSDFGNGRFVRNLLEQATMHLAERLSAKSYSAISDHELTTLIADDFVMPELSSVKNINRIGF